MITYLGSSGLMIETGDAILLIDGLVSDNTVFDKQSEEMKSFIDHKLNTFDKKKVMLFTHGHADHYDDDKACRYMREGKADVLIVPGDERFLPKCTAEARVDRNIITMTDEAGRYEAAKREHLTIEWFRTEHLSYKEYDGAWHFSFSIHINGRTYIVLGDADAKSMEFVLKDIQGRVDGLFITPVLLGRPEWIKPVTAGSIERIYIYHLPSESTDRYGYRKLTQLKLREYQRMLPDCKPILKEMIGW